MEKTFLLHQNRVDYSSKIILKTFFEWAIVFIVISCSLFFKHTMIVIYASSVVNKLEALLTDDARVIIYDCHVFIVQATG